MRKQEIRQRLREIEFCIMDNPNFTKDDQIGAIKILVDLFLRRLD